MFPTSSDEEKKDRMHAWSLHVVVDKDDPSKVLALGLDSLKRQNGKTTTYEELQPNQAGPKIQQELIERLDAKMFGKGKIEIEKDKALEATLIPQGEDFELTLSMRISVSDRFTLGGREKGKRTVMVKFDKAAKKWYACATVLKDAEGADLTGGKCVKFTGIAFVVKAIGIDKIIGVIGEGDPVILHDKPL